MQPCLLPSNSLLCAVTSRPRHQPLPVPSAPCLAPPPTYSQHPVPAPPLPPAGHPAAAQEEGGAGLAGRRGPRPAPLRQGHRHPRPAGRARRDGVPGGRRWGAGAQPALSLWLPALTLQGVDRGVANRATSATAVGQQGRSARAAHRQLTLPNLSSPPFTGRPAVQRPGLPLRQRRCADR